MKKFFLLFVVVLLFTTFANAQNKTLDKKVRFGFKIDAGSSWLGPKESYVSKNGSKFYFGYGFISDFTLTDNYIISTGLNITSAGGSISTLNGYGLHDDPAVNNGKSNTYTLGLQYLEIPLALKLKTDPINNIRYWGQFGTYLGINMGARLNAEVDGITYEKEKITSTAVPINMGLDLGIGIEYPLNSKTYGSVGLGFRNGFIDVTKQGSWNDGKVIMNGFFLRTAVFF